MKVNFDYFDRPIDPKLYLCNPNNNILSPIINYDGLCISPTFNGTSALNVNVYKYIKDKDTNIIDDDRACDCWKYIEENRQIHVENLGYFIISKVSQKNDNINPYFSIEAISCEIELNDKALDLISGTYQFYNAEKPSLSILGKILALSPLWKLGSISNEVIPRFRTFDDFSQNIYSFMAGDMANAYECIIDFDIEHRIINVIDSATEIPSTDIFLTFDNVIKNVNIERSTENIVTALTVVGADDLEIRMANPLGTNDIYAFDYYMNTDWASQNLIDAINIWKQKIITNTLAYNSLVSQILTGEGEYATLNGQLSDLTTALKALKQTESIEAGLQNYPSAHANVMSKQIEVSDKQSQVTNKRNSIIGLNTQLTNLQSSLNLINNLTQPQLNELNPFIKQCSYKDENITITPVMTYSEKLAQIQFLYQRGQKILAERCKPTYTIVFECVNFLLIPEFERFRNQLEIGKMIHVELNKGNIVDMMLLKYEINYDSKDLKITVSNRMKIHDKYSDNQDIINQVTQSASTMNTNKAIWSYGVKSGILSASDAFIKNGLNLDNNPIINTTNQQVFMDTTGYHGFKYNSSTNTFDPEQIWITNNKIVFTNDNWNSVKAAFGKFRLPNGNWVYGLNADAIVVGTIDAKTINVVNIIADNIKTGMLESDNGRYSLNMNTGEVIMRNGIFSGKIESSTIEWTYGDRKAYGLITCKDDTRGLLMEADYITLDSKHGINTTHLVTSELSIDGNINVKDNSGSSYYGKEKKTIHFMTPDGDEEALHFIRGVCID